MLRFRFLRVIFAAFLCSIFAQPSLAQSPAPLSAYGELPQVEDAAISPSGSNVAVLLTDQGIRQVMLIDSSMSIVRRMGVGDTKVRYFEWIGDEQLLVVSSRTEDLYGFTTDKAEFSFAQIIPVDSDREPYIVFSDDKSLSNAVFGNYGTRFVDNRWVLHFGALQLKRTNTGSNISNYTFDHGRPYLFSVDAWTNKSKRVAVAPRDGYSRDWVVNAKGEVVATMDVSQHDGDWRLGGPDGSKIMAGNERNGRVGLVGLGYDGTTVIYSTRDEDNISRWLEIPLAGGTPKPFLRSVDVDRLYFNEITGHLMGYLDADKGPVFADPEMQKSARGIKAAFANYDMRMVDWTPDFSKVIARTSGNQDSGSWFIVDLKSGEAKAFAYERMDIEPGQVGPISVVEYTAQDGLEMDGILTLPPGREAKDLPLIMLPHGGPHAYDRAQFDWWAQAFASRGYAVFQPNFRGSTNRDQTFTLAGYGQWGRKMQTDLSDGLNALAEKGIVDPDRACIVGASYGGYAALAGVTLQQGIYKCAVAVAPVSDIEAMYYEDYRASGRDRTTKTGLLDQLGPKDSWKEVSPRRFADRADAPIMLIHGVDDTVVPYLHSHKMADALKDAKKPYELVKLEGEDHWLSLSETRLKMLEAAVGFVEKHNPPD